MHVSIGIKNTVNFYAAATEQPINDRWEFYLDVLFVDTLKAESYLLSQNESCELFSDDL